MLIRFIKGRSVLPRVVKRTDTGLLSISQQNIRIIMIEHPVRQLPWCALSVLKTARENHNITSEAGLQHYLLKWLSGVNKHSEFRSPPDGIVALKALTEKDRNTLIIGTPNTFFLSSAIVGEYPSFRFQAALGKLQKAGWRTYVCPWSKRVLNEPIERACSGRRHPP